MGKYVVGTKKLDRVAPLVARPSHTPPTNPQKSLIFELMVLHDLQYPEPVHRCLFYDRLCYLLLFGLGSAVKAADKDGFLNGLYNELMDHEGVF
jgi:hypothetical protein